MASYRNQHKYLLANEFNEEMDRICKTLPVKASQNLMEVRDYLHWRWMHTRLRLNSPTPAENFGLKSRIDHEIMSSCLIKLYENLPIVNNSTPVDVWLRWWQEIFTDLEKAKSVKSADIHEEIIKRIRQYIPQYSMSKIDMDRLDKGLDRVNLRKICEHMEFWCNFCKEVIYPISTKEGDIRPVWNDHEVFIRDARIMLCMGKAVNLYDVFIEPDEVIWF